MGRLLGLFPGTWWVYLVIAGVIAATAATASWRVTSWAKDAETSAVQRKLDKQIIDDKNAKIVAMAQAAAEQAARDKITHDKDVANAYAKGKSQADTITKIKEVTKYVTPKMDADYKLPYGLIRVLDAKTLGVPTESLSLPAGVSDDDPSPVTISALAGTGITNIGICDTIRIDYTTLHDWIIQQEGVKLTP